MKHFDVKIRLGLLAVSVAMLVIGFRAMIFEHLPGVFGAPEEDLSFGWYVPLFSLYVLWTERAKLKSSVGAPSWAGLVAMVPFFFLGLLGARGLQVRFELIAFIGLLIAVPWAIFGREMARRVFFPAAFLVFCMPLNTALSLVTVHLRLIVSAVSAGILSGFGMDIVRQGNMIALPGVVMDGETFVIDIANPCSGLRSIFALLALAAGYGYFTQPAWLRRAILFALAIPCAVVGNILRIMTICIVAKSCDASFAIGFYHDFAGYIVFLAALAMLVGFGGLLNAVFKAKKEESEPKAGEAGPKSSSIVIPAVSAIVLAGAMAFQAIAPNPVIAQAPKADLPKALEVFVPRVFSVEKFMGTEIEPSVAETNLLVGATLSKMAYSLPAKPELVFFNVSTVTSGPNKQSLHRPELCLPSQGFDMGVSRTLRVGDTDWRIIPLAAKGGRGDALFAYTFFNQSGYRTDSHVMRIVRDTWDRTFSGLVDRWVMVSVQLHVDDETLLTAILEAMNGEMSKWR